MAVGYSLLMPVWEGPDEHAHYLVVLAFARLGRNANPELNYEAHQPQGYYRLAALVINALDKLDRKYSDYFRPYPYFRNIRKPVRIFDWTDDNYRFLVAPHLLRWLNILLGAGALWLNWKAFRIIVPEEPAMRIAALALAALTPQYLHSMSVVSNDALGALAGALLFYLSIRVALGSTNLPIWFSAILAILLPLVTKLTVLPVGLALLLILAWKQAPRSRRFWRWLVTGIGVVFMSLLALYILSPTLVLSSLDQIGWRALSFRESAFTLDYLASMLSQVIWSFWGKVGWLAVGLPVWLVILFSSFGLFGGLVSAYKLIKCKGDSHFVSDCHLVVWIVTWMVALLTIAAVLRNGLTTTNSQGRFLFPALGALALLMAGGWHDVLPKRFRPALPWVVVVVMLSANFILWGMGILPVYYQPFID
jgi:hypothetical protein